MFLGKGFLKIYSTFTREHSCRSVISIKLICNIIEITLLHGYSPVNLLYIFRTSIPKNTSGRLLLYVQFTSFVSEGVRLQQATDRCWRDNGYKSIILEQSKLCRSTNLIVSLYHSRKNTEKYTQISFYQSSILKQKIAYCGSVTGY